jgi:hypothetical protein
LSYNARSGHGYGSRKRGSSGNRFSGKSIADIQNSRSLRAKLQDASMKAPIAKSIEDWMAHPNRLDLPDVDMPKGGPVVSEAKMEEMHKQAEEFRKDQEVAIKDLNSHIITGKESKEPEIIAIKASGSDGDFTVFKNFESNEEAKKIQHNLEAQPQAWAKVEPVTSEERLKEIREVERPAADQKLSNQGSVEGSTATFNKATGWMAISFDSIPEPEIRAQMKAEGFRYNPSRKQWIANYLPSRESFVEKLAGKVEKVDIKPNWAAKAEHAAEMSAKHIEKADEAHAIADKINDMIPFGQPVLVGHHSERRHLKDIDRFGKAVEKSIEERKIAEKYADRAANYGAKATGENPLTVHNRIKQLEADKRKMQRELQGDIVEVDGKFYRRKNSLPSLERQAEVKKWIAHYDSRLEVEKEKYKASGGLPQDSHSFKAGEKVHTPWGEATLLKVSDKTVRVKFPESSPLSRMSGEQGQILEKTKIHPLI